MYVYGVLKYDTYCMDHTVGSKRVAGCGPHLPVPGSTVVLLRDMRVVREKCLDMVLVLEHCMVYCINYSRRGSLGRQRRDPR